MEYDNIEHEIKLNRNLNELDRFVINFINKLEKHNIKYVIVSGYVSIILGRSRGTEDVDLLIQRMDLSQFIILFNNLIDSEYECANTSNPKEAYEMLNEHAIRFFIKGKPIPNIEFKLIKKDLDKYSFENKIRLITKDKILFLSPLELQIAFKLFLAADGTDDELQMDKDIEDARFVYKLFEDKLNKDQLNYFIDLLNVKKRLRWLK